MSGAHRISPDEAKAFSAKDWVAIARREAAAREYSSARIKAWYAASAAFDAGDSANPFDETTEFELAKEWDYFWNLRAGAKRRADERKVEPPKPAARIVTSSAAYAEQLGGNVEVRE